MAWTLEIHMIDVGQGDSTLIVAEEPVSGLTRSMLIDGGESAYAPVVDGYVDTIANLQTVDHIVCTHYDKDHRGGLQTLLLADDLSDVLERLAFPIEANMLVAGADQRKQIAAVTASVYATASGYFGTKSGKASTAAVNAAAMTGTADTLATALGNGLYCAEEENDDLTVQSVITSDKKRAEVAMNAGEAAADAYSHGDRGPVITEAVRQEILRTLQKGMAQHAGFRTAGRYWDTNIIDLGVPGEVSGWADTISGTFNVYNNKARATISRRTRTSVPTLGSEVLWSIGPGHQPPPPGAPRVFVVAADGEAWQGDGIEPETLTSGKGGNSNSVGLLILFNDFAYCTLGDMGAKGEESIMTAIRSHGLPDPDASGRLLAVPARVAGIKCSHHGSDYSTSSAYLASANPATALISAGGNAHHHHPTGPTVDRLHHCASIRHFFLTNCLFRYDVVPASKGGNQLTALGNKSRLAGDNNPSNLAPGRHRGNIKLVVTAAQSLAAPGAGRQFAVSYWEPGLAPAGPNTIDIPF